MEADVPGIGSKAGTWFARRMTRYSSRRDLGKRETWSWILLAAKNNGPIRSPWAKSMRCRNQPSSALPLSTWGQAVEERAPRCQVSPTELRVPQAGQWIKARPGANTAVVDCWPLLGWTPSERSCVNSAWNRVAEGGRRVRMTESLAAAGAVRVRAIPERPFLLLFLLCPLGPARGLQVVDYQRFEELERVKGIEPSLCFSFFEVLIKR